jgi:hypothetical protein
MGRTQNDIYKRVGDLTIASPSIHNIIFKTNNGTWESMRLNTGGISMNTSLYVSGTTIFNNTTTCLSSLNVSGVTTFKNSLTNFWYNSPGTYFSHNGFASYFNLTANVMTNGGGVNSQPFITVYNRMWKNGANSAIDIKSFGNSNSGVNSDVLIRIDSGGDPLPGTNAGTITYNINGSDRHIMTGSRFGINTTFSNLKGALDVIGVANIHNGSRFAVFSNFMASGSLTIGGTNENYGTATNWSSNTAGLMMECQNYTEIVVHDADTRLASFMYYDGVFNSFFIGRNKGWGTTQTEIVGNLTLPADRYIYSSDAMRSRLHFVTNGYNIYQSYGPYANAGHLFQNSDAITLMTLRNNGNLDVGGQITSILYTI